MDSLTSASELDYWELRTAVSKMIPRQAVLSGDGRADSVRLKEKGRKSNYHQFNIQTGEMVKLERLLSTEGLNSFVEVSLRAQSCPMPLNLDLYDGLKCPYACKYCIPAGTKVLMADGTEKVAERVRIGDRVMSLNTESGEYEIAEVTEVLTHTEKNGLWKITTDTHQVSVTGEHPIFTKRGWVPANQITPMDEVAVW